ncbi:MAG: O-antigen ligase family protein [Gaiella sp.]
MDGDARPAPGTGRGVRVALHAAVALCLALAVFAGGASGEGTLHTTGGVAVAVAGLALVVALLGRLPLPRLDRAAGLAVGAGAGLVLWIGLSMVWSIVPDASWAWLNRGLVYAAFVTLGLLVGASVGGRRVLVWLLAAVLGAALVWALLGIAIPSLAEEGDRVARLREPVGYWNALALLADAALALGVWVATSTRAPVGRWRRVVGTLLVFGSVVVIAATQSRAGVLAAALVLGTALALASRRLEAALVALCGAVPAIAVSAWVFTRPALVEDAAGRAARVDDAPLFALALGLGVLAVVGLAALLPFERLATEHRAALTKVLVGVLVVGVLLGAGALVAAVGNPVTWARDQVSGGECANDPGRLTELCDNNRLAWWSDAVEIARAHPLLGTGAGSFEVARLRVRDDATPVTQPHSVPLQLLADLGVIGLLLGVAALVAAAIAIARLLRRLDGEARWEAAALAALPLAWVAHALIDYDLDLLAVTAPALVASGALLAGTGTPRTLTTSLPALVAVVGVTLAALVSLWLPALARTAVDEALTAPDLARAADAAARARSLDPLSLEPLFAQAFVAELAGDAGRAQALLEQATRMQPENPAPWLELGRFHFLSEPPDLCAAYTALNEAYTLDQRSSRWVRGGPLDVARAAVNDGACER